MNLTCNEAIDERQSKLSLEKLFTLTSGIVLHRQEDSEAVQGIKNSSRPGTLNQCALRGTLTAFDFRQFARLEGPSLHDPPSCCGLMNRFLRVDTLPQPENGICVGCLRPV